MSQPFKCNEYINKRGECVMNFHNRKTRKVISTVIIVLLILSMTVPLVISAFS